MTSLVHSNGCTVGLWAAMKQSIACWSSLAQLKLAPFQGVSRQQRKPLFHLFNPTGMRVNIVEMDVLVSCKPHIPLRFVRVQVVNNNLDFSAGIISHDTIHKI